MKLLLDTHTFIWWDSDPARLSPQALALCQDPTNVLLISAACIWEIQIKLQAGKLSLRLPLSLLIQEQQQANHVVLLPVLVEHVLALEALPPHHKDPFDRLLVAQANVEQAILISNDPILRQYPVQLLW